MNIARIMRNSLNEKYLPDLIKAFSEIDDDRVKGMLVWSMGKIGNAKTLDFLVSHEKDCSKAVQHEIKLSIEMLKSGI